MKRLVLLLVLLLPACATMIDGITIERILCIGVCLYERKVIDTAEEYKGG